MLLWTSALLQRNILFLARLLRNNCFKIKRRLNVMREIVDDAQIYDIDHRLFIQYVHEL